MAKKSKDHKEKQESHSNQHQSQNQGQGRGRGFEDFSNNRQKDQGNGMVGANQGKGKGWKDQGDQSKEKERMDKSFKSKEDQWLPEANQPLMPEIDATATGWLAKLKNACLPKALILFLPFIAVGAYLLLRS